MINEKESDVLNWKQWYVFLCGIEVTLSTAVVNRELELSKKKTKNFKWLSMERWTEKAGVDVELLWKFIVYEPKLGHFCIKRVADSSERFICQFAMVCLSPVFTFQFIWALDLNYPSHS